MSDDEIERGPDDADIAWRHAEWRRELLAKSSVTLQDIEDLNMTPQDLVDTEEWEEWPGGDRWEKRTTGFIQLQSHARFFSSGLLPFVEAAAETMLRDIADELPPQWDGPPVGQRMNYVTLGVDHSENSWEPRWYKSDMLAIATLRAEILEYAENNPDGLLWWCYHPARVRVRFRIPFGEIEAVWCAWTRLVILPETESETESEPVL